MQESPNTAATHGDWTYHDSMEEIQTDIFERLIVAGLLTAGLWFLLIGLSDPLPNGLVVAIPPLLATLSVFVYYASRKVSLRFAAAAYVAGLSLIVLGAAFGYADATMLVFLAIPVGVAGLLLGPRVGFLSAVLISAGLLMIAWLAPSFLLPPGIIGETISYSALMAALVWVAIYPLRTTLQWAWSSYEREREQTEAARTHRAELTQSLANLDIAYRRLETMAVELERARQAAIEARRLKSEFAANISHELRTPLNMIIGFSEMMVMSPQSYDNQLLPAAYRGDVGTIYRNAKHLSQLIDDVLDLSQIEAARMSVFREQVAIADVIKEATDAIAQSFKIKDLAIKTEVDPSLPLLDIDRTRIRQVLINLLSNAGRFTDQGSVTISAQVQDSNIIVAVADTGIGIKDEDLPKLFEEFRQLDGSIRRRAGGSGLGLSISRKLVELHGGRMWVNSKAGAGTTIYFSLPLGVDLPSQQQTPEWELRPFVGTPRLQQKNVVAVSREPRASGIIRRYLDDYHVITVSTLADAWKQTEEVTTQAVLCTMSPGDLGWLSPKSVQDGHPNVPVVAVTLRGQTLGSQQMPVFAYLQKPVLQEQFLAILQKLGDDVHSLLVVDDDPDAVNLLSRMARLAPRHYRVTKAYGGQQAQEMMSRRRPDALVLDLLMPDVDGYAVLDFLQTAPRLKDIPVIVVTARGREQETITVDAIGFTRSDGFSVGEMIGCVKAALEAL